MTTSPGTGPTTTITTAVPAPATSTTVTAPQQEDENWDTDSGTWGELPAAPLAGRYDHGAVWTGRELLVLVGDDPHRAPNSPAFSDSAAYDPAARRWRSLATAPALDRWGTEAVWTGREAVLWGGYGKDGYLLGAAYDPATDRWRALPDAPILPRREPTMVWTGAEVIVWGGIGYTKGTGEPPGLLGDGAAYNPVTDTWRRVAPSPLNPRSGHTAEWTGTQMLVWGGGGALGDVHEVVPAGAAYDPTADRWEVMPEAPIDTRGSHSAVWTGRQMLVYGGTLYTDQALTPYSDGAAYNPATRRWEILPRSPLGQMDLSAAIWTGRQMIIWGGNQYAYGDPPYGAAFEPGTGRWTVLTAAPLAERWYHRMVWTGEQMLVWGGYNPDATQLFADGASFSPSS